jgi:hypothetical protein
MVNLSLPKPPLQLRASGNDAAEFREIIRANRDDTRRSLPQCAGTGIRSNFR